MARFITHFTNSNTGLPGSRPWEHSPQSYPWPQLLLKPTHCEAAVQLLHLACTRDPAIMHLHGTDSQWLREYLDYRVRHSFAVQEPVIGHVEEQLLHAVACVSLPEHAPTPPELEQRLRDLLATRSPETARRGEAFTETVANFYAEEPLLRQPHYGLYNLAVHPRLQGQGLGTRLLQQVLALSAHAPHSHGMAVETLNPGLLPFYENAGFRRLGEVDFCDMTVYFLYCPHERTEQRLGTPPEMREDDTWKPNSPLPNYIGMG